MMINPVHAPSHHGQHHHRQGDDDDGLFSRATTHIDKSPQTQLCSLIASISLSCSNKARFRHTNGMVKSRRRRDSGRDEEYMDKSRTLSHSHTQMGLIK